MTPPFFTWRDLPESREPIEVMLSGPFRNYFGGKTPEMVLCCLPLTIIGETREQIERRRTSGLVLTFVDGRTFVPRPFAIGMEGYIRLEKFLGTNMLRWPARVVGLRRGLKRGHPYIEIVK